jgi:hypothetical protein
MAFKAVIETRGNHASCLVLMIGLITLCRADCGPIRKCALAESFVDLTLAVVDLCDSKDDEMQYLGDVIDLGEMDSSPEAWWHCHHALLSNECLGNPLTTTRISNQLGKCSASTS